MRAAIVLERASAAPLHRQIYDQWRQGILTGRFRRAERVPSTRELSSALGVSRSTVTLAYEQLASEGYLESARGSGTFVCRQLPDELLRPHHKEVPRAEAAIIACLCGSDERYAQEAVDQARALKAAGCRRILLAGRPGPLETALREAGVDGFLYAGCDAVALLSELLDAFR